VVTATATLEEVARALLAGVADPEVPVVSIVDLGIVRGVAVSEDGEEARVDVTPTYSGCPAMRVIEDDIVTALHARFPRVVVRTVLAPPWTTDWMTETARQRLADAGIAPPHRPALAAGRRLLPLSVSPGAPIGPGGRPAACPQCGSTTVELISEFGSTACKALYRCGSCAEPFDYFKAH
jgi:ring-1,2-phenylacetyl-CoA epoxidase subunit PaaD